MKLSLSSHKPRLDDSEQNGCLVVLVDAKRTVLAANNLSGDDVTEVERLIEQAQFEGKLGQTTFDHGQITNDTAVMLVGIGDTPLNPNKLAKIAEAIYQKTHGMTDSLTLILGDALTQDQYLPLLLPLLNASYRFTRYKSEFKPHRLKHVQVYSALDAAAISAELDYIGHVFAGQSLTRDLANEPSNVCHPTYLAQKAKELAQTFPDLLTLQVIEEDEMQTLGMGCFLSVSQGSEQPGKLVVLQYEGADHNQAPKVAVVGKGITFDTGGISLKPGASMDEMKFDMGGAAAVLGVIKTLCLTKAPIRMVGALACAENMPSGRATRPGDIVRAMNGKTVEILNTDAEGRMVLSDALCYVQKNHKPKYLIDVATLTGACIIALGHHRAGLYGNDQGFVDALHQAGEDSGDLVWPMPLDDAYQNLIDSNIADLQNMGGRAAGSVSAAKFISNFIEEDQVWAHLDVAGTAWKSGKEKGATGRPVPLLLQYIRSLI